MPSSAKLAGSGTGGTTNAEENRVKLSGPSFEKLIVDSPATVMQPLVRLSPRKPPALELAGSAALVLAAIGGLASLFAITVIAVMMLR